MSPNERHGYRLGAMRSLSELDGGVRYGGVRRRGSVRRDGGERPTRCQFAESAEPMRRLATDQRGGTTGARHRCLELPRSWVRVARCSTLDARSSPQSSTSSTARCGRTPCGEVARGLENVEFECGLYRSPSGQHTEPSEAASTCGRVRQPSREAGIPPKKTPFTSRPMVALWMGSQRDRLRQQR